MSQLMSKDVLYEPLKELHDKVRQLFASLVTGMRSPAACDSSRRI